MSPAHRSDSRMELVFFGWLLVFVILALIAAVLGFTDLAGRQVSAARTLFVIFLIISLSGLAYRTVMGKRFFGS